jgi:hypothetical protein
VTSLWLKYRGTQFPIRQGESVVGRSPYCTVVLDNRLASRRHCRFTHANGQLTVEDLGSSNGTAVNGQRITAAVVLVVGDVIRVGTEVLEVVASERRARRGRTQTARAVGLSDLANEETTTSVDASTLELVEELSASAARMADPNGVTDTIRRAVDTLLQTTIERRARLEVDSAARLRVVIERVARCSPDRDLDAWRAATIDTISRWEVG